MELTRQQSENFTLWYKERYAPYTWEIPVLQQEQEKFEIAQWQVFISEMLWKKYNKTYKYRAYGKQTIWEKVFSDLWLSYWPRFITE